MKIWAKTEEFSEGKYLVVRRDGSIPLWPHFVLGARDRHASAALRAYAESMLCDFMIDRDYIRSIRDLADDFDNYNIKEGDGDPDAPPHRVDDQATLFAMRREGPILIMVTPDTEHLDKTVHLSKASAEAL